MALEIERKFLVKGDFRKQVESVTRIMQGYICAEPGRTVRIRIADDKAFLTIKGPADASGMSRYEFEQEVPYSEALELQKLCIPGSIEKERFHVNFEGKCWEVDVFYGANEGLVLAEIELSSPDETVILPDWIGKEVTNDKRYYNSKLTKEPYNTWNTYNN